MKILLVHPPKAARTIGGEEIHVFEPLALESLGAAVRDHHDVRILDMRFDRDLRAELECFEPDVVGLTAYTVDVPAVLALAAAIKAWRPEVVTVVGGHHATVAPAELDVAAVDLVVRGEGTGPLVRILAALERHAARGEATALPPLGIAGVRQVVDGRIHDTPAEPLSDLDSLPAPARDLTARYRASYFCEWMKPLASLRTSKGCPFRCDFCALWKLTQGRYLRRAPEQIVAELATIAEPDVFFADDESLLDEKRMTRLAELIGRAELGKRFFLYGRSDTIARHPELLARWKEVGLERVFVGLESFRDEDLRYVNKGSTAADNERAIAVLQDLDIDIYASFIVRPDYTEADFDELERTCQRLGLGFATFSVLTPLPGTDLYARVEDQLITRDPALFDFLHTVLPTTLPLPDFYRRLHRLYRRAIPFGKQLGQLRRYPLREIPGAVRRGTAVLERIKNAHRDHLAPAA